MIKNFSNLILSTILLFMLILSTMRILTYYEILTYTNYSWAYLDTLFLAITLLTFLVLRHTKRINSRRFLFTFLGLSGGKPIVYAVIILIYGLNNPTELQSFAFTFLAYYLIFSIFEIWGVIQINKGSIQ
ncbi:MAG: hypothetical protein PHR53_01460 [Bacteroidales bacterium]|nr:hypothetical protein [Bacteroidales bacterium]